MPDIEGTAEDSDWEYIEDEAKQLHDAIATFADSVRDRVANLEVDLPPDCVGRAREKWRPLKRVAIAAGRNWPQIADGLIARGLAEDKGDREDGLRSEPPAMTLMRDLHNIWPAETAFMKTVQLVAMLTQYNPQEWGYQSRLGKPLTETRFGRMVTQATKARSTRIESGGPRGYLRADLSPTWRRLGVQVERDL